MRHPIRAYSFIISHAVKSLEDVKFIVYSRLFKKFKSMSLELDEDDYDCQILSVQYSLICVAPMLKGQKNTEQKLGCGGFYGVSMVFLMVLVSFSIHDVHHWLAVTCRDLLKVGATPKPRCANNPWRVGGPPKVAWKLSEPGEPGCYRLRSVQICSDCSDCSDMFG